LENMIERAVILAGESCPLDIGHLFTREGSFQSALLGISSGGRVCRPDSVPIPDKNLPALDQLIDQMVLEKMPLKDVETTLIQTAVAKASGNLSLAARMLGMTRPQLAYRFSQISRER